MVFLAVTPDGLMEAMRVRGGKAVAVWCGCDAISEADYAALGNANVSRFIYPLQGLASDVLSRAMGTIQEHYPSETQRVERCA